MVDNDQVTSIIAAMSTSKDGWHLSCDLDNIRNDGKIVAALTSDTATRSMSWLWAITATMVSLISFRA